jgi:asparagine synthase (glutamine-hydrolysing)
MVVLSGDGGDELFAGYSRYKNLFARLAPDTSQDVFEDLFFQGMSLCTHQEKLDLYQPGLAKQLSNLNSFEIVKPLFDASDHMDRINQALYVDSMLLLPGNNLVKPDRMGMAVSIEARTPFMDVRMLELAFRIPGALKLQHGETKAILKKSVEHLLPKEIIYRDKQMFVVPVGEWFRHSLAPFIDSILLGDRFNARGLFSQAAITTMLTDHQLGQANHTRKIRALLALEIWCQIFLDQAEAYPPALEDLGLTLDKIAA